MVRGCEPHPAPDPRRLRRLARRRPRRGSHRLALPRRPARRGPPGHRRAARHPALPPRRDPGRRPRARARRRAPGAVGRADAALALHRRARPRHPRRGPLARPARAAAPGRSLRRAGAALPRPEDRGDRRGAARRRGLLRSRRPRCRGARARHHSGDRRLQHVVRDPEPVAPRPRRGGRRRAGGLAAGWVSFSRPDALRELLAIPARVEPVAYLCLGWPDERPVRPGLESAGWAARAPPDAVVMGERWTGDAPVTLGRAQRPALDRDAAIAARDRLDKLVKPAGSLGALEPLIERWASITGAPPPPTVRAGVLV